MHRLLNSPYVVRHRETIEHLWRFYSVAIVNTAFGFGMYALLVWLGVNLYIAQIASQVLGMTFNFFMFRKHVFRAHRASVPYYIVAYGSHYLMGLFFLALYYRVTGSAYLAGFLAAGSASLVNFAVLKFIVFTRRIEEPTSQ